MKKIDRTVRKFQTSIRNKAISDKEDEQKEKRGKEEGHQTKKSG